MLSCRDVSELATDFMERTLSLRARLGLRLHLSLCVACRTYLDQLRKTVGLLRQTGHAASDPDIVARVVTAARQARAADERPSD
jgi:Putative zinc-finger